MIILCKWHKPECAPLDWWERSPPVPRIDVLFLSFRVLTWDSLEDHSEIYRQRREQSWRLHRVPRRITPCGNIQHLWSRLPRDCPSQRPVSGQMKGNSGFPPTLGPHLEARPRWKCLYRCWCPDERAVKLLYTCYTKEKVVYYIF